MAITPENALSHYAPDPLEHKARAAVQSICGEVLSEEDWQRVRARLREFGEVLRRWGLDQRSAINESTPKAA